MITEYIKGNLSDEDLVDGFDEMNTTLKVGDDKSEYLLEKASIYRALSKILLLEIKHPTIKLGLEVEKLRKDHKTIIK